MMLTIDSRENSKLSELIEKKSKSLSIPFERKWIEIGDYVYDDVCFEAKSVVDFIGSVMSKRMWTQLDNMDRCYKTNVVVIYGDIDEAILQIIENSKGKSSAASRAIMLRNKFLGALGRIVLDTDIKPFWVSTVQEAALIITSVCKIKPFNREAIRPQIHKRLSTDDMRLDVLTSIKGLSSKKAKALLDEFGCLMEIGECSEYEMQVIEGIGSTLAKRIIATLNSEEKVKI